MTHTHTQKSSSHDLCHEDLIKVFFSSSERDIYSVNFVSILKPLLKSDILFLGTNFQLVDLSWLNWRIVYTLLGNGKKKIYLGDKKDGQRDSMSSGQACYAGRS